MGAKRLLHSDKSRNLKPASTARISSLMPQLGLGLATKPASQTGCGSQLWAAHSTLMRFFAFICF